MTENTPGVRKLVYLTFPPDISGKPNVCNLVRLFDLCFNILKAQITPRKEGFMTLEISGSPENIAKGLDYLRELNIKIDTVAQKIARDEDSCTHCGLCTAICPTDALLLNLEDRHVVFNAESCTACGWCTRVCPVRAMSLDADLGALE